MSKEAAEDSNGVNQWFRKYVLPLIGIIGAVVAIFGWVETRFGDMSDDLSRIELRLVTLVDANETRLVEVRSGIVEAIDRNEEWLSKEHQQNTATVSGMLVNIGHGLGYAERMANEKDHARD